MELRGERVVLRAVREADVARLHQLVRTPPVAAWWHEPAPALHGRGLGTDALRTLARHLLTERGHHRSTIDPEAGNAAAIRCYERVGFRPVGTMRAFGRSAGRREWRDALLLDLLAGELR